MSLLFPIAFFSGEIAAGFSYIAMATIVYTPQTSTSNATGRWISSFSLRAPNSTAEMVIYTNDRSSLEWNRARLWDIFFNLVATHNVSLFSPPTSPAVDNISIVFTFSHNLEGYRNARCGRIIRIILRPRGKENTDSSFRFLKEI